MQLVLLVKDRAARMKYEKELKPFNVKIDITDSINQLHEWVIKNQYNGVFLDISAKMSAPRAEQILLLDIMDAFPICLLRWNKHQKVTGVMVVGAPGGKNSLSYFVNSLCKNTGPRKIRALKRYNIHLNVLLFNNKRCSENTALKTVTTNISNGGCFIITGSNWKIGDIAYFELPDLGNTTPISGEIRWGIPWNNSLNIPGIGVMFTQINLVQLEALRTFINSKCLTLGVNDDFY